jgi:DNA-directed RNA polymerase specialized sigma24 family protein
VSLPPFSTFLEEHRVPVLRYLTAAVGPHDAADCFQETFLAALRAYPRLTPDSNLTAWVFTIAHRKVIDAARARSRRPVPVGVGGVGEREPAAPPDPLPATDGPVWAAVRSLPPKQRTAVVHRIVGDRSYAEIAAVLGCSEDAARQSVSTGLRRLREELAR